MYVSIFPNPLFFFLRMMPVNVETESAYTPERLVVESVKVMRSKISVLRKAALALGGSSDGDVEMEG
jgi:hypothetical protein